MIPILRALMLFVLLSPSVPVFARPKQTPSSNSKDIVTFNTQTHKYHGLTCVWAKKCTVHCIDIPRAEALRRGGIPCKVCGGS